MSPSGAGSAARPSGVASHQRTRIARARLADRLAVEGEPDEVARLPRAAGVAESAGRDDGAGRLAGRFRGKSDVEAAAVGVGALAEHRDHGALGHERGQGHAAEPRLIGLDLARAAGEGAGGEESQGDPDQDNADHPPRLRAASRFCFMRLPQTSISHQRRPLFLVVS